MLPRASHRFGVDNAALAYTLRALASARYSLPPRLESLDEYRDRMLAARTLRESRDLAEACAQCIPPGWGAQIWGAVIAKATDGALTLDMGGLHADPALGHRKRVAACRALAGMLGHYWHKHGLNPYREAIQRRPKEDGRAQTLDLARVSDRRCTLPEASGTVRVIGLGPAIAKRWFSQWYESDDPRNAAAAARRRLRNKTKLEALLK